MTHHATNPLQPQGHTVTVEDHDLDGGGGTCLRGLQGVVRIVGNGLRSLDVENSPALEALDLSQCCDDLRLHLTELPRLRWLQLPPGPTGATIELALGSTYAPIAPLVIHGPIADFGLCAPWLIHPFRIDRDFGKRPIAGLTVGPPTVNPPAKGAAAHLVVGRACRNQRLSMNCRGISHLVIMGTRLQELELRHASLKLLDISECPRLEHVGGRFQARKANISVCRKLSSVDGTGQWLDIGVINSSRIAIGGRWLNTRIALADCETVELVHRTRLRLDSLPVLMDIESQEAYEVGFGSGMFGPNQLAARLAGRPGELTRVVERERKRFGDGTAIATHWLRHLALAKHGHDIPAALGALRDIAGNAVDREACWLLRCQIAAQRLEYSHELHRPAHALRRGSTGWNWAVRSDPRMDHWIDDLCLYCRCADLEVTAPFRRTLARLNRLPHATVLAAALADTHRPEILPVEIRSYLRACLARVRLTRELAETDPGRVYGMAANLAAHAANPTWCRLEHALEHLIGSLGVIRDMPSVRLLADHLCALDYAPVTLQAGLQMFHAGMSESRKVLAYGLKARGEPEPEIRTRALQYLLAPLPQVASA
jgi:hypothetical protein